LKAVGDGAPEPRCRLFDLALQIFLATSLDPCWAKVVPTVVADDDEESLFPRRMLLPDVGVGAVDASFDAIRR
jgi:hypothetical protein